jgi:ABC-type xylose transport system substrate-binding protein
MSHRNDAETQRRRAISLRQMAEKLGNLTQDRWTAVDRYIDDSLLGADETLDAVLQACAAAAATAIQTVGNKGYDGFAAMVVTGS